MEIYIKGMEMPTNCGECELCACYVFEDGTEENYRCPMTMYPVHDFDKRHYLCPLVPVPPHGRLIDAEKIYDAVEQRYRISSGIEHRCERDLLDLICAAPTIIPAEEGE